MDELAKIKSIKKDKQSRAYVTGLHSTPAGMEAANLLLRHIKKTGKPALFILIAFPDIDRLLSLGSFSALKDAWPVMAKRLNAYLPSKSLSSQTQFGLLIQVWDSKASQNLAQVRLQQMVDDLNRPFSLSNSSKVRSFSLSSYAGYLLLPGDGNAPEDAESLLSKLAIAATSAKHSEKRFRHFTPALQKLLTRQEYAISNLPLAISEERLELKFEPQFSAETKSICGAQTKVTWHDLQHGNISGTELTNACSITGKLPAIVRSSLDGSVSFLNKLEGNSGLLKNFRVSVSVPFEIFQQPDFDIYDELEKRISKFKVNPNNLCIELEGKPELTSAQLVNALSTLKKIKKLNLSVSLNSVGEHIALKLLSEEVVSYIKWNLESTDNLNQEDRIKLLDLIIAIARCNRIGVIVGGINLSHQIKLLNLRRIAIIQGSIFSEPLSDAGFHNYLKYSTGLEESPKEKVDSNDSDKVV